MVAFAVAATKEYHTSSSGVPVAQPTGIPLLADAFQTVPELFAVPRVNAVAPVQLSFAGGIAGACVTQMLNVASFVGNPADPE
jgi:hypothetical protein